jgi:hypothetical protein
VQSGLLLCRTDASFLVSRTLHTPVPSPQGAGTFSARWDRPLASEIFPVVIPCPPTTRMRSTGPDQADTPPQPRTGAQP